MSEESLELVNRWRDGDEAAAQEIYERYVSRLIALAGSRISPVLARRLEAEDVVQSVYRSFFARAGDDRLTVDESGELWRLLAAITINKVRDKARFHRADKRNVATEASVNSSVSCFGLPPTDLTGEPTAEEAAMLAEQYRLATDKLTSSQREVFRLYLENEPVEEIARRIRRSARTVRRELDQIRRLLTATLSEVEANSSA